MLKPLVSVVLPFYKEGAFFENSTNSIINQTLENWELLLVNNNADELTAGIAKKLAAQDKRIRIITEHKQGIAYALNTGIRNASADFIARMDADDYSYPQRLEKQSDFLIRNPEIGLVATQTVFSSDILNSEGYAYYVNWQNGIISPEAHCLSRFIESPIAHPSVMFRKELLNKYGYYSTDELPEDYELWLRLMAHGVKIQKLDVPLLQWNDHEKRLSRNHNNYDTKAFLETKCSYLALWLKETLSENKRIVILGSSKNIRQKAACLSKHGINIYGFSDVKETHAPHINFIPHKDITKPDGLFLINFISKRGVSLKIANHFKSLGFVEGKDFILAG